MNHGEWEPLAALRALIQLRYEQGNWHAWRQQTPQLTQALRKRAQPRTGARVCAGALGTPQP